MLCIRLHLTPENSSPDSTRSVDDSLCSFLAVFEYFTAPSGMLRWNQSILELGFFSHPVPDKFLVQD